MSPYRTEWVAPERLLTRRGVKVYHVYDNDDVDQGPLTYHFTTSDDAALTESRQFDVRDLKTWKAPAHPPYTSELDTPANRKAWDDYHKNDVEGLAIRTAIIAAIDRGLITVDGVKKPKRTRVKDAS